LSNEVIFAPPRAKKESLEQKYKVLIVDDDKSVHIVTKLSLKEFIFEGYTLEFASAFSEKEAKEILSQSDDFVIILLDVIMEKDDSGFRVANFIRNELNNKMMRIILRTGQHGNAPESEIITRYDINDYRSKTELSAERLFSLMYTSIRNYKLLEELNSANVKLQEQSRILEVKNEKLVLQKQESEHYAKELAQSLEFKTQFFRNISHELKTPLNSIMTLSELLLNTKKENITSSGKEKIEIIFKAGKTLLQLIEDVLTLSKIEANKHVLKKEKFSISTIVEATYELFDEVARKKNIELILNEENTTVINNDKEKLTQVLNNLVSNAVKFTHKGSVIINIKEENNQLRIDVIDTGIGVEKDSQRAIFEAFTQADATIRRKFEGSGVGLAICKEYMSLMGGKIKLKSSLGVGSTFSIYLPID